MEHIKAGSIIIHFLRRFGGFSNAKGVGFWGSGGAPPRVIMLDLPLSMVVSFPYVHKDLHK